MKTGAKVALGIVGAQIFAALISFTCHAQFMNTLNQQPSGGNWASSFQAGLNAGLSGQAVAPVRDNGMDLSPNPLHPVARKHMIDPDEARMPTTTPTVKIGTKTCTSNFGAWTCVES